MRSAFASRSVTNALHRPGGLHNPAARAAITAGIATAAWHHGGAGWWRHGNGGYGWVGPVFWPYAYYDLYDYALWGYGYDSAFWDYGYTDLYAGLFAPYGYDDLNGYAGYLPGGAYASRSRNLNNSYAAVPRDSKANDQASHDQISLAQMCGQDSRDIAGLPVDAFANAIQPNDEQRAALNDLAAASQQAAQKITAACPADIALTAPQRLAAMQTRIEAMSAGVQTLQPPLEKLYSLLSDEQKAKLNGLAQQQQSTNSQSTKTHARLPSGDQTAQSCSSSQSGLTDWPGTAINNSVRPTEDQRAKLETLQSAANSAADMLKTSCQPANALTPPARLTAVGQRLDIMLQAVKTVRPPIDDFYASLNDEQKANFDAIGPQRASSGAASTQTADNSNELVPATHHHRHHHGVGVEHMIRRMMSFVR